VLRFLESNVGKPTCPSVLEMERWVVCTYIHTVQVERPTGGHVRTAGIPHKQNDELTPP
jgi:hypothetical protein